MYIFDLDGTITDTNSLWVEVDREFLTRRGLRCTPEYLYSVTHSIYPVAAQFTRDYYRLPDSPEAIMAEWDALAERHYRELAPLKPGAAEFLRQCHGEGRSLALFTACRPSLSRAVLERFHLWELFSRTVFAEDIGLEKSDPACFARLSELVGVPLKECTLFDDYPENCAAAAKAGMRTVGVFDAHYAHRQEELKAVCHRYVRSFEDILY